jgi:acyl CoA:acetate/3-ketoacid CoA transferase alpha subunit
MFSLVSDGGFPIKLKEDGKTPLILSKPKEVSEFNGVKCVREECITADFAIIKAYKADKKGNLCYRKTAQNFNADMATAAKITIAEVEEFVDYLDPALIDTPGIYVHRVVKSDSSLKRIEKEVHSTGENPNLKKNV